MNVQALEAAIRTGERVLIDTSTFIAYLNRNESATAAAAHLIDAMVHSGRNPAIVSMVTLMEVLVRPLRVGTPDPYHHILDFVSTFPNLRTLPIDLAVAQEAASIRATYRLPTPDALIVATGIVAQVHHLVTNDAAWVSKLQPLASRIRVCHLDHYL